MGMPVNNGNLISIGANPGIKTSKNVDGKLVPRQRNSSSPALSASYTTDKPLERKYSAPELPPIGIKPYSPSYSSPVQRRQLDSPLELNVDNCIKRTRQSPLSPTSTTSSHEGSNRSLRHSPAAGGISRSRTWTGDLNSSQHDSGKLETLYEAGPAIQTDLQNGLAQLSIIPEGKSDKHETRIVSVANSTITAPPPIDRHMNIKSTQTITVITPSQKSDTNNNNTLLPATAISKTPQLTANRLSQENLRKLRHTSQSSSVSSSIVPVKASSDTGYDTDEEKEHRIVEWLIGIESSHTQQPPETVDLSTTEKRDTAIHIVYEGD